MIRALTDDDAEAFVRLRREGLVAAPLAFGSSPEDDRMASIDAVREHLARAPEATIFGVFRPRLAGVAGLFRDPHAKAAHKAHVWGMYVIPELRRQGLASRLLEELVQHARALPGVSWVQLSVSSAAPGAQRLYEQAGFQLWGTEPEALRHGGETAVEHHMALRID